LLLSSSLKTYKFGFINTVASALVGNVLGKFYGFSSKSAAIDSIFGKGIVFFCCAIGLIVDIGRGLVNESKLLLEIASLISATDNEFCFA
jgi:hypothetical protein